MIHQRILLSKWCLLRLVLIEAVLVLSSEVGVCVWVRKGLLSAKGRPGGAVGRAVEGSRRRILHRLGSLLQCGHNSNAAEDVLGGEVGGKQGSILFAFSVSCEFHTPFKHLLSAHHWNQQDRRCLVCLLQNANADELSDAVLGEGESFDILLLFRQKV